MSAEMNTELEIGEAGITITTLKSGELIVRRTTDGMIVHSGYAQEGAWSAIWAIIKGMTK